MNPNTFISLRTLLPALALTLLGASQEAFGANLLLNSSFEEPIVGAVGNNFPATLANWTVTTLTAPCESGHNVILAGAGYGGGPDAAIDGNQYYDICGAAGYISQTVVLSVDSVVTFGGYFSRRDNAAGGGSTAIYDETNVDLLMASPTVLIPASDSQELWQESMASITLAAGTYTFRANIDDPANADGLYFDATPVPEPGSAALVLAGLAAAVRRRRA